MINYEMALSEIEMYKKAHKSLSENLKHANNTAQQYKNQRDTLIDDIAVLKANISRLEQENEKLKVSSDKYTTLTNHIRDMKFASPYSYNYIHLVNFIKGLERK